MPLDASGPCRRRSRERNWPKKSPKPGARWNRTSSSWHWRACARSCSPGVGKAARMTDQRSKPRILTIDDTPANLQLLATALAPDFAVQIATSGAMGLALVAKSTPDLILLDVMMPEMDGHEVCRRLKADPRFRAIPVIFLSALDESESESAGLALGAADYISK